MNRPPPRSSYRRLAGLRDVLQRMHVTGEAALAAMDRTQFFKCGKRLVDLRSTGAQEQTQFSLRHGEIQTDGLQARLALPLHGYGRQQKTCKASLDGMQSDAFNLL